MTNICLALIVKNAADTVGRCIESAKPLIDRWVIIDTGSTDDTKAVIAKALEGIPGSLLEQPWVDFATNRTQLLAAARESGAEYVLMLDADLEVQVVGEMPPLVLDEYNLPLFDRGLEYVLPLLTRAAKPFFYAGVAHACLNCSEPVTVGRLQQLHLIDHGGGPGKDGKFERDLANLSADVLKNPNNTRSWFYLAQTYRDLDKIDESIEAYKHRALMGGYPEEVYYSLLQVGVMMCEHKDFVEGVEWLMRAYRQRPHRAEALRAIAGITTSVANKLPYPASDQLFVDRGAHTVYLSPRPAPLALAPQIEVEPIPPIAASMIAPRKIRRRPRVTARKGLSKADVSAILVTRGNVDLEPILASLPYDDIVVWNNSEQPHDYKVFGRYMAIPVTKNPVIYWQDDDVIFTAHDELLAAYEPGRLVTNMDDSWVDACGYRGIVGMQGAGSLCDASLPAEVFERYLSIHPFDDDFLTEADFVFGVLAPFTVIDVGYEPRSFTDDPDRLYMQPGQQERKWAMIRRAQAILNGEEVAA